MASSAWESFPSSQKRHSHMRSDASTEYFNSFCRWYRDLKSDFWKALTKA
jgi:hypothetical protein